MIGTVAEAAAWLEGLIDHEKRPGFSYKRLGLEPALALLARLGDPHEELAVVHVAGSKGKGSTALFCESVLRAAGESVGTFTSPHLERWTERFRIDGKEVPGERLAAVVERLRPHVEALREDGDVAPTFFDATTAAALLLFRDAGVDRAVLEVGLGGRLDSTNVVSPDVACVTSIEREHTQQLGDSIAGIAREKAGIVKPGAPVVVGRLPEEALEVVLSRAREVGAEASVLDRDFAVEVLEANVEGVRVRLSDGPVEVETRLPVLGAHQGANAALALACARRARRRDEGLAAAAREGLASARLPGRVELLGRAPWIVVDGAHTEASARALAAALDGIPRRRARLVLSISAGKDATAILGEILPGFDEVTVTRAEPVRSLAPNEVADAVRASSPGVPLRVVPNPHLAVRAARDGLGEGDLLCVSGSVYLAGIARRVLRADAPAERVAVTRGSGGPRVVDP